MMKYRTVVFDDQFSSYPVSDLINSLHGNPNRGLPEHENIAIYGLGDLGKIALDFFEQNNIAVKFIFDQNHHWLSERYFGLKKKSILQI